MNAPLSDKVLAPVSGAAQALAPAAAAEAHAVVGHSVRRGDLLDKVTGNAVYVGDRIFEDVWGPQQIGMRAIWIPHSDLPRHVSPAWRPRP